MKNIKLSLDQLWLLKKSISFTAKMAKNKLMEHEHSEYDEDAGVYVNHNKSDPFLRTSCFSVMAVAESFLNLHEIIVRNVSMSAQKKGGRVDNAMEIKIELNDPDYQLLKINSAALVQSIFVYLARDKELEIKQKLDGAEYHGDKENVARLRGVFEKNFIEEQKKEQDRKIYRKLADRLVDMQ